MADKQKGGVSFRAASGKVDWLADGSVKYSLVTSKQMDQGEYEKALEFRYTEVECVLMHPRAVKKTDAHIAKLDGEPEVIPDKGRKDGKGRTPSQGLRAQLYVLWRDKYQDEYPDFNDFYEMKIQQFRMIVRDEHREWENGPIEDRDVD